MKRSEMAQESPPKTKLPEYNILLLSETGTGKSTTINAIANYLKYPIFEEAKLVEKLEHLVPMSFTLPGQNGSTVEIQVGDDLDERSSKGTSQSSTLEPRAYLFRTEEIQLRIIDTPGVGETSGLEAEQRNFQAILDHLLDYETLHGICFLVKSGSTRANVFFRYCFTELLKHLHKSACDNILFCFTFGRSSFYQPGDCYSVLLEFLKTEGLNEVVKLSNENSFFIDNEGYRILLADKMNYPVLNVVKMQAAESWNISAEQIKCLLSKVRSAKPHELRSTQSLNNARKVIAELTEPLVQMQYMMKRTIHLMKYYQRKIKDCEKNQTEFKKLPDIEIEELEAIELEQPSTICTDPKCVRYVDDENNGLQVIPNEPCHVNCSRPSVEVNVVSEPSIRLCRVFKNDLCTKCGHEWQKHVHVKCRYKTTKKMIKDLSWEKNIENAENTIECFNEVLKLVQTLSKEFQEEFETIEEASALFSCFLNQNSITAYNRHFEDHIKILIRTEAQKLCNASDKSSLENLKKIKEDHAKRVEKFEQAIANKSLAKITVDDIERMVDKMCKLKHMGAQLSRIMITLRMIKKRQAHAQKKAARRFAKHGISRTKPNSTAGYKNEHIEVEKEASKILHPENMNLFNYDYTQLMK